jgi:hypothetical protein
VNAETILRGAYPSDLVDATLSSYKEIESNYAIGKWKASELDAGHFVEAVRRILEHSLFGSYTIIGKSLPNFTDTELKRYEQAVGDESFRILMPRVLKSIYNLRNKRGVGHLGPVSPNEMDATLILYSTKWVLSELIRLTPGSHTDPDSAQAAVNAIIERRLDIVWRAGDTVRILRSGVPAKDQILILLYESESMMEDDLRTAIEYANRTNFRVILRELHKQRAVEYIAGIPVLLTPKGLIAAEKLILALR